LADGLPARRHGDKLIVDIDVARLWIEAHEGAGRVLAPVLHSDDPRFRERTAAAGIRQVEADLRRGVLVKIDDVDQRIQYELGTLRHTLLGVPSIFALPCPAEDIESTLAHAIEAAISDLKADRSKEWPQQMPRAGTPVEDWLEAGERDTLPLLVPGDPRHAFASAQADIKESKLSQARAGVVAVADVLAVLRDSYAKIRERLRAVPFAVALTLEDGASVFDVVRDEIYKAMGEISGAPREGGSEPPADIDAQPFDEVDGISA
jgi:hypothetical protein